MVLKNSLLDLCQAQLLDHQELSNKRKKDHYPTKYKSGRLNKSALHFLVLVI
ncbi:hypothetical protein wTpre_209 [Wolbachia endosymbiont of Trichogramma pretiosum]|nr:hypothetical protein wTpre_209 [Wolbachia endosymbiont of Trichogramma pretiosum]